MMTNTSELIISSIIFKSNIDEHERTQKKTLSSSKAIHSYEKHSFLYNKYEHIFCASNCITFTLIVFQQGQLSYKIKTIRFPPINPTRCF